MVERRKEKRHKRTKGINEGNKARRKNVMQERIIEGKQNVRTKKKERDRLTKREVCSQNEDVALPTAAKSSCADNCCKCRECVITDSVETGAPGADNKIRLLHSTAL
jgi:hypothetical protein